MSAMVVTVALAAAVFPPPQWYGSMHGAMGECGPDQALTGACTSGKNKDCSGKTSHRISCQAGENLFDDKMLPWIEKGEGDWAICPEGSIAVSRCASGKNGDCKVVNNKGWNHALRCKPPLPNWKVLQSDYKWLCGHHGDDVSCPVGYVVTESCGSGKNNDCDTRGCVGRPAWSGLKCNRLVDAADVKFSSESPEGTVRVQLSSNKEECELKYHLTEGVETFGKRIEYVTEEGFAVTTTASSSLTLSLQQTWSSSIGVSKGPITGTFGSETTFTGEWTTSSEIVESRYLHTVTTTSAEHTTTVPANTYVAVAKFLVFTVLDASVSADLIRVAFTDTYLDTAVADYREVFPVAYSTVVDVVEHPNFHGLATCPEFVAEFLATKREEDPSDNTQ